ncbi:MAG: hypothetical protein F4056_05630 [Chloroflexi bacterium]|nr:hypothetical protein [Chloroflexota bacterium]
MTWARRPSGCASRTRAAIPATSSTTKTSCGSTTSSSGPAWRGSACGAPAARRSPGCCSCSQPAGRRGRTRVATPRRLRSRPRPPSPLSRRPRTRLRRPRPRPPRQRRPRPRPPRRRRSRRRR